MNTIYHYVYNHHYETRDYLAGERWTERVVDWRGWSSQPLSVSVVLKSENHFAGEVALSVFPSSSNLSSALAQTRVQLADGEQKIVTLTLDIVDSSESMAGSYTIVIKASGGGVQREARFGVNINVTCD